METNNKRITQAPVVFLLAMLCCFLWGSATPAIKIGYQLFGIDTSDTVSIILFAGIRFFIAGILVILFQSLMSKEFIKPDKGSFPSILKLSLAQTIIQYFCYYVGVAHTSGVTGTILSGAGGFFSILAAVIIFRYEKMTSRKTIGCILGLAGVIIMNISLSGGASFNFTMMGEGLVLLAQISYGISGNLVKKYSRKYSVAMLSGYQFILGGLIMIAAGLLLGGSISADAGLGGYILLLYMALISAVAYSVWGLLMKYNPVSKVAIYNFMVPLFGVILSAIFLNELEQALQINKLIALILVSVGIYVVNARKE